MPTGRMIFSVVACSVMPIAPKALTKLSTKKLKYLKKANISRLTAMLATVMAFSWRSPFGSCSVWPPCHAASAHGLSAHRYNSCRAR